MKKKILFVLVCAGAGLTCFAQKSHVYVKAGVNFANVSVTDNGRVDDAKTLTSFQAGLLADLAMTKFIAIQTGAVFTGKGSKTQLGN